MFSRGDFGGPVPLIEAVRGEAKLFHGGVGGMELAASTVDQYADDLATRGYQLHERLRTGVAPTGVSWEIYRASSLPRQPSDVAYKQTEQLQVLLNSIHADSTQLSS